MDRICLGAGVWAIVLFILLTCPLYGSTIDVSESVGSLVEADWIRADFEFISGGTNESQAAEVDVGGRFSLVHTNQLIIRGYKLARRLRNLSASESRLKALVTELRMFDAYLDETESVVNDRRSIYLRVRSIVRQIAMCNPLLDFDKILFIKRHHPGGVYHMCDQYYGFNVIAGGGLFILSDPFGANPKLTDLLADTVVERGRLKGSKLTPGGFLCRAFL